MQTVTAKSIIAAPGDPLELEGMLGESNSKCTVLLNDEGVRFKTKKDDVFFPCEQWLNVLVNDKIMVLAVHGYGFSKWAKKRKFEQKNPGSTFVCEPEAASYIITFNPKKNPGIEGLEQRASRSFQLGYIKDSKHPDKLQFAQCPDCLLYTSPSPRDGLLSRMPSSA